MFLVQHHTIEASFEPFHGFLFRHSLVVADSRFSVLSESNTSAFAAENNVEVHTEDTGVGVVFHAEIDVFLNTESEVASG